MEELQICSRCHRGLPHASFGKDGRTLTGRRYECRECVRTSQAEYYRENQVAIRERQNAARRKKREKGGQGLLSVLFTAVLLFISKIKLNS